MSTQYKEYTSNNNAKIFFQKLGDEIYFSPFLESFSMERDVKTEEYDTTFGKTHNIVSVKKDVFDISFNVPSESWEEAKENHRKFSLLIRMNLPDTAGNETEIASGVYVRFSNLIHNMSPDTSNQFKDGVSCKINNISYKPDLEFGFFDKDGMLFAKNFKISLQLILEGGLNLNGKIPSQLIDTGNYKEYCPGKMFGFKTPFGDKGE